MIPEGIEHFEVQAGEVRLHCAAMGPHDGPLVLLLHGFPECWVTWRAQLPALAAAGYRAVAPDLRGYGKSDKPREVAAYRMEALAGDVAALIAALGRDRADVVGHDWGGQVAWFFAMWHPAKLRRLAVLNNPHPQRFKYGMWKPRQLRKSWYILFFQLPVLPERFMTDARLRKSFTDTTERKGAYGEEEIEILLEAVRDRSGPIHYYRAAARHPPRVCVVEAQTLVIWGEEDRWLGSDLAAPEPRWVPHARVERSPRPRIGCRPTRPTRSMRCCSIFSADPPPCTGRLACRPYLDGHATQGFRQACGAPQARRPTAQAAARIRGKARFLHYQ